MGVDKAARTNGLKEERGNGRCSAKYKYWEAWQEWLLAWL